MDNTSDLASEREDDSGIESAAPEPIDTTLYIRISLPETKTQVSVLCLLEIHGNMHFNP